jgi:predicted RNA binding protein YcfA (HicA-like mRNA interferase family)
MPPRLPQTDGDSVVALLRRLGNEIVRTRGSHVQLKKTAAAGVHCVTVPAHKTLAKGTPSDILNRVSQWNGISKEDLLRQLQYCRRS